MSEAIVAKFGGTSMAYPELVADIVGQRPDQQVVVVSAPGTIPGIDEKMTDTLYRYHSMIYSLDPQAKSLRDEIIDRFDTTYAMLGETDRAALRDTAAALAKSTEKKDPNTYNYPIALGEKLSAEYFAKLIGATTLNPAIRFRNKAVHMPSTEDAVIDQIETHPGKRLVIPGFYGYSGDYLELLGRGGSDRTGALYARALDWDYENWTDVDGIYSADPRVVPEAQVIPVLTREEVREGAHGGSGVLQGNAIVDLNGSHITTTLKNTFNPSAQGTRILSSLRFPRKTAVVAVSGRDDLTQVNIRDLGMAEREGYAAEVLTRLGRLGLSFEHMPTSQDSFSVTIAGKHDKKAIDDFVGFAKKHRLSDHGTVKVQGVGAVYVIGEQLRRAATRQAVLVRILGSLAAEDISALPIMNVASPSLALLVEPHRVDQIVRQIHAQEIA